MTVCSKQWEVLWEDQISIPRELGLRLWFRYKHARLCIKTDAAEHTEELKSSALFEEPTSDIAVTFFKNFE